jgi:AcrR family transcriptional regulator
MKQSPKQPAEKRRTQLINAAEKIFSKKGYGGTTTADIARAARLTKGALYFHFKNKEDIFSAVIKKRFAESMETFNRYMADNTDIEKFAEKTIIAAFEMIEKHQYFSVDFWQRAHKIPKIKNYITEQHNLIENNIVAYLTANSTLKKKECQSFVKLLHAMLDGVMIRQMVCCEGEDLKGLKKIIIELSRLFLKKHELNASAV